MNSLRRGYGRVLPPAVALLAAAVMVLPFGGCLMYLASEFLPEQDAEDLSTPTQSSAAQITLAWDPPGGTVLKYRVYFRIHGTTDWVQLVEIPAAPAPEYTVLHSTLGNGEFDFGVIALYDSSQSALHSSLDASASPTTGWYLKWQR